jgi:hypothetical protein
VRARRADRKYVRAAPRQQNGLAKGMTDEGRAVRKEVGIDAPGEVRTREVLIAI